MESELHYHIAEKEVLAIFRTLEDFRPRIHGSEFPVVVYTRYSVLKWLLESNTGDGRHLEWGLELSRWTLEIHRTQKDEDGLAAILGSGITPREHLDEVAETLIPAKERLKVTPPDVGRWQVVKAEGHILEGVTVNDAEYHGLILGLKLAMKYDLKEFVAVGDSRIVVQKAQGLINCNQPNLQRRLADYEDLRKNFVSVKLTHVKREFNQAADYLTSKTLVLGESWELDDPATDEVCSDQAKLGVDSPDAGIPESLATAAEALMVMTRSRAKADASSRTPVDQSRYQDERWRRIKVHQDEDLWIQQMKKDLWIQQMKKVLKGDVSDLPQNQVKKIAKVSDQFVWIRE
ncbi:reverse transcriptase [Phytophthora megakarya]|uniref:Reverse transcriptase n=1 Tax=Phytophthora megakarya TaxID=4795 RepID=A0A225W666_9STRA|nr:reverse transcriptase [Phytophthora megakarya]